MKKTLKPNLTCRKKNYGKTESDVFWKFSRILGTYIELMTDAVFGSRATKADAETGSSHQELMHQTVIFGSGTVLNLYGASVTVPHQGHHVFPGPFKFKKWIQRST